MVSDPPGLPIIFEEVTCQVGAWVSVLLGMHTWGRREEEKSGTDQPASQAAHSFTSPLPSPCTRVCLSLQESPCIMAQMAKTNPGFAAQVLQAYNDQFYVFDSWTAVNAATGAAKTVKTNLYEDVADADYTVKANFKPLKVGRRGAVLCSLSLVSGGVTGWAINQPPLTE